MSTDRNKITKKRRVRKKSPGQRREIIRCRQWCDELSSLPYEPNPGVSYSLVRDVVSSLMISNALDIIRTIDDKRLRMFPSIGCTAIGAAKFRQLQKNDVNITHNKFAEVARNNPRDFNLYLSRFHVLTTNRQDLPTSFMPYYLIATFEKSSAQELMRETDNLLDQLGVPSELKAPYGIQHISLARTSDIKLAEDIVAELRDKPPVDRRVHLAAARVSVSYTNAPIHS